MVVEGDSWWERLVGFVVEATVAFLRHRLACGLGLSLNASGRNHRTCIPRGLGAHFDETTHSPLHHRLCIVRRN